MRLTCGAGLVLLLTSNPVTAQQVNWRQDYAAARKEATAAGKPLVLDFGTEGCIWCRRLDATTFRDPTVVQLLNDRFIPVKVDAEREERLTQAAGVQSFPTIVVVSPDGKVVNRHEGYADAAKMSALLRQSMSAVPKAAPKPPSSPAPTPTPTPSDRTTAAELLTLARADHDAGRYLTCIERCDRLMSGYGSSPEAAEARRLSAGITGDPAKWRRVTVQIEADLAVVKRDLDAALGR
jgi:thiol-disulfide isomerase/thioredoxin